MHSFLVMHDKFTYNKNTVATYVAMHVHSCKQLYAHHLASSLIAVSHNGHIQRSLVA